MKKGKRHNQIGLDRLVRLEWLETATRLIMSGSEASEVGAVLREELKGAFRSSNPSVRGSLDKTITIVMKTWVRPIPELVPLREDGLKLLASLPSRCHAAVHWGMIMAAYPFWGVVAAYVGRLLALQEVISSGQVQRRVREQYGERETAARRARYVLRSFIDWGVLQDGLRAGEYKQGHVLSIDHLELVVWLIEALLHFSPEGSVTFREVLTFPGLFPFRIHRMPSGQELASSGRIEVVRHGLDDTILYLK